MHFFVHNRQRHLFRDITPHSNVDWPWRRIKLQFNETNSVYRGKCPFSNQSVQSFIAPVISLHVHAVVSIHGVHMGLSMVCIWWRCTCKLHIREYRNVWLQTSGNPTLDFIYRKSQNASTATFIYFSIALDKMLFDINRQ